MQSLKQDISSRKADHISINLEKDVQSSVTTGLERVHFVHLALPEINLDDVNPTQMIFGKNLQVPLLISSMTGGTKEAAEINYRLAEAAQHAGIAMGLGSQRPAVEEPALLETFQVRKYAPDILLFANIGAVQMNYGYTPDDLKKIVESVGADAIILHFNALQEALQPAGDTNFKGLLKKIESVCRQLNVPVIAKEVGWGFSEIDASRLAGAGVSAIDVAGAGGTSWSQVEMYRIIDETMTQVAASFRNWGISTLDSLLQVKKAAPGMVIIASGGLRNGVDIAKCIALGAQIGGMAGPFLKAASQSPDKVADLINKVALEIRICMFLNGAVTIKELQKTKLTIS